MKMYKTKTVVDGFGNEIEHIFMDASQGGTITFPNTESNTGSERQDYLDWLAAGNTPEPADE
jgi:hypothetical protein